MIVKLLTECHLEFLSLTGGCRGLSESTHVKMPHCWKSQCTGSFVCEGCDVMPPFLRAAYWKLINTVFKFHPVSTVCLLFFDLLNRL